MTIFENVEFKIFSELKSREDIRGQTLQIKYLNNDVRSKN